MALTVYSAVDGRFTTKGSKLTIAETDANWVGLHDLIDANTALIQASQGGVVHGVQEVAASSDWNGISPIIEVDTSTVVTVTILTADVVQGNRVTILDATGNAASENITVIIEGGQTISGAGSYTISDAYGFVTIHCGATNTFVINENN